jgi:hypothetical protein
MPTVITEVDVDLDDFDIDDLCKYVDEHRDVPIELVKEDYGKEELRSIGEALKLNNTDEALQKMTAFISKVTGMII